MIFYCSDDCCIIIMTFPFGIVIHSKLFLSCHMGNENDYLILNKWYHVVQSVKYETLFWI